jgi:hypothetical protein
MYYPLLRARQFELITIRELVVENAIQGVVTPIFELSALFSNYII